MQVLPISDLHIEWSMNKRREDLFSSTPFEVLIRAGDIWEAQPEKAVQSAVKLARGKPAIIVPGNHNLYTDGPEDHRTFSDFIRLLRGEAERQNARTHRGRQEKLRG